MIFPVILLHKTMSGYQTDAIEWHSSYVMSRYITRCSAIQSLPPINPQLLHVPFNIVQGVF